MRSPYLVIFLGALVMAYSLFHVDVTFAGQVITDVVVFAAGLLIAVIGAAEHLADSYLGESR